MTENKLNGLNGTSAIDKVSYPVFDWHNLYGKSWGDLIVPAAVTHPAKFSNKLINQIYDYLIEEGLLKAGDTVVDPFGGVGLGAEPATRRGVNWIGVELEQHFVDIGGGMDCPGFTQMDWRRLNGRASRSNHKNGLHLCPDCVKTLDEPIQERKRKQAPAHWKARRKEIKDLHERKRFQLDMIRHDIVLKRGLMKFIESVVDSVRRDPLSSCTFDPASPLIELFSCDSAGEPVPIREYKPTITPMPRLGGHRGMKTDLFGNHDRCIPARLPHRYTGNIDKWNSDGLHSGTAVLLHGDSRELAKTINDFADLSVSSPPFGEGETRDRSGKLQGGFVSDCMTRSYTQTNQGQSAGNLATLKAHDSDFISVSSPPYANAVMSGEGTGARHDPITHPNDPYKAASRADYGRSDGNLGNLSGTGFRAAVGSPPFVDSTAGSGNDELTKSKGLGSNYNKPIDYGKRGILMTDDEYKEYANSCNLGDFRNATDTFWSAARQIVDQVHGVLKPGATAVWVTKRYVRNKEIVEFSKQWEALCHAAGFETIAWARAWLVEDNGTQVGIFEDKQLITKRASFFRRLYEKKFPENAIDWEDVIIMRKVAGEPV